MLLSLEIPTGMLKLITPLTDFEFALTHLVLSDQEYQKHYAESANFKILDNSVNETGTPTTIAELEEAARIILPDVICPPDYFLDADKTLDALEDSQDVFDFEKILPILQGDSHDVATDCAWEIHKMGFNKLAIPYSITKDRKADSRDSMAEARYNIIYTISGLFEWIHLLGVTTLDELGAYSEFRNVSTLDTGVPITAAFKDYSLASQELHPKSQKMVWDGEITPAICNLALYNIAYLRTAMV